MNSSSLHFNRDQHFQDLISHIEEKDPEDIQVPQNYSKILRDYQVQGFKWLKTMSEYGFGGILADDMGLGKTFVGAEKMYLLNNNVNLIVCQKSKIEDWVDHIRTFYPEYWVMDLTNKNDSSVFRKIMES